MGRKSFGPVNRLRWRQNVRTASATPALNRFLNVGFMMLWIGVITNIKNDKVAPAPPITIQLLHNRQSSQLMVPAPVNSSSARVGDQSTLSPHQTSPPATAQSPNIVKKNGSGYLNGTVCVCVCVCVCART